jgi:hypothetical protein
MSKKLVFKLYYGIQSSRHYDDLGGINKLESKIFKITQKYDIKLWKSFFNKEDKSNRNAFPIIGIGVYDLTIFLDGVKGKQGKFEIDLEYINVLVRIAKEKLTKTIIKKMQKALKTKALPELHYCMYYE